MVLVAVEAHHDCYLSELVDPAVAGEEPLGTQRDDLDVDVGPRVGCAIAASKRAGQD